MNSYWCGANVAYNFCDGKVDSYCGKDKGTSGAGTNKNKNMMLGAEDWLSGSGPSSMMIAPYDPVE